MSSAVCPSSPAWAEFLSVRGGGVGSNCRRWPAEVMIERCVTPTWDRPQSEAGWGPATSETHNHGRQQTAIERTPSVTHLTAAVPHWIINREHAYTATRQSIRPTPCYGNFHVEEPSVRCR